MISIVYLMMISKTMTLNVKINIKKGVDFMKVIALYVCVMVGAVLLEQMVVATKFMKVKLKSRICLIIIC